MKNSVKKTIILGIVMLLAGLVIPAFAVKTEAAEKEVETTGILARVVVPEEEVFSAVTYIYGDGIVTGSGVRLRKRPNTSATILELMNYGEYVDIVLSESTANWYYLERVKTGTMGFANKKYILAF